MKNHLTTIVTVVSIKIMPFASPILSASPAGSLAF
jgi:hypothetical protein